MLNAAPSVEIINQNVSRAIQKGIAQLNTKDKQLTGKYITTERGKMLHFGSCSYLGLELDPRMKRASIAAIEKYGTQFSSSRAYLSLGLYEELEDLLAKIYGQPTALAPTTSLGHIACIPVIVGRNDAIILDHQVHASVQNAVKIVKSLGVKVEMVRHNNMNYLERTIQKLAAKHTKVWYMADGIYSMYGDKAPLDDIHHLLNHYKQLHLYIDDAHGMSWTGKNGSGLVLESLSGHPRMYLITSLAKAFGSCGGAMIFPNKESRDLVRNCGSTMMFSGPLQPAVLGASIQSAKIHLSDEINSLQLDLKRKIHYFTRYAKHFGLPLVKEDESPIFFIGAGKIEIAYELCSQLLDAGFYLNVAAFPSVPYNNAGLRMTITRHHSLGDINKLLITLSHRMEMVLSKAKYSKAQIFKAFKMPYYQIERVVAGS